MFPPADPRRNTPQKPPVNSHWVGFQIGLGVLLIALLGYHFATFQPEIARPKQPQQLVEPGPIVFPQAARDYALDYVLLDMSGGKLVLRVRAVSTGDEMVIDAATGKLLAIRDNLGNTILPGDSTDRAKDVAPM